ncbi:hypothetical protein KNE206_54740 [Kitasatospora sp. NE20-6]
MAGLEESRGTVASAGLRCLSDYAWRLLAVAGAAYLVLIVLGKFHLITPAAFLTVLVASLVALAARGRVIGVGVVVGARRAGRCTPSYEPHGAREKQRSDIGARSMHARPGPRSPRPAFVHGHGRTATRLRWNAAAGSCEVVAGRFETVVTERTVVCRRRTAALGPSGR